MDMNISGNMNRSYQNISGGSMKQLTDKPPVTIDARIRTINNRMTQIDNELDRNLKDYDKLKTQFFQGIQQRDKLDNQRRIFGILAVVAGFGASAAGGGIPSLILLGLFGASSAKMITSLVKSRKITKELRPIGDEMTMLNSQMSIDDTFKRAEKQELKGKLTEARKERENKKDELLEMAEGLKGKGQKKGVIEDLGDTININGVPLKKREPLKDRILRFFT